MSNIKGKQFIELYPNHFGEDVYIGKSLKQRLEVHIKELASRHYQSSVYNTIAGGKIATTSSEKVNSQIENKLYSVGETIKLDTTYDNNTDTIGGISEEINQNVNILRFDLDPTIFIDSIIGYEALIYKLFGIRINQRFKKERAIKDEVANDDHEFNAADFNLRQSYEKFILDYKKMFNKDLELVDNLAPDDEEEQEDVENAGENEQPQEGGINE